MRNGESVRISPVDAGSNHRLSCAPCAPSAPCAPWVAVRFYPGTNGAASPTRYTMPPEEVLAAMQDMAANGWRLGAIAHSHPRGAATPSPTDLREAFYPEALMVIVSLAEPRAHARAWWVGAGDGRPREVPIVDPRDSDPLQPRQGSDG